MPPAAPVPARSGPRMVRGRQEDLTIGSLTVSLAGLSIGANANVHINISPGTAISSASAAASAPAPPRTGRVRFYVIASCVKQPDLEGIWERRWSELGERLPGKMLFGSSAKPCKGFDSREEARALWERLCPEREVLYRRP